MAGQVLGSVNVRSQNVSQSSNGVKTINVQIGSQTNPRVNQVYSRQLKGSSDLNMKTAQDGDIIVYQANTNSFVVESAASTIPNLDAGEF